MHSDACPCGGGAFTGCCKTILDGERVADSPEELMRSRYSAMALGRAQYLVDSRHSSTRGKRTVEQVAENCRALDLRHLTILETCDGATDDEGFVEFRAVFVRDTDWDYTQERSRFLRESGRWYFVSSEFKHADLAADDPCWCRSGRAFGACHSASP